MAIYTHDLYEKLKQRAASSRRSVSQEVIHLLARELDEHETTGITALRGLGKEHWRDVDPVGHVAAERDAWD